MAVLTGVLLAMLLDPVRLVLTLGVVLFSRKIWIIPIAAICSAVVVETMLTSSQMTRDWGEGIVIGFLASLIQASLIFLVRKGLSKKKAVPEPEGSSTFPSRISLDRRNYFD